VPPWRLLAILLAITPTACAAQAQPGYRASSAQPTVSYGPWLDSDYRYRISAGDELQLNFIVQLDMNTRLLVGPDGRVTAPLAGTVMVAGLTPEEAGRALTTAYGAVLRNPQVETLVATYGAAQVYVGGEVRNPGVIPIRGQINTAQAIIAAGGFQDTAKTGKVVVLRRRASDNHLLLREVDVRSLLAGRPTEDFQILPGDLIFVPKSNIAEVNLFVRQYLNGVLPFNFGFSYDLNRF
jgi:protein involved in polysaccharide export with SLBB domain